MQEKRTIRLSEGAFRRLIKESVGDILRESDWNLHYSRSGNHDFQPYVSDSKQMMFGRDTGHFGSGTYFSTYKDSEDRQKYIDNSTNPDPHFIKVDDRVYRVDFDLYKNLYRVRSKKQGDVLYTLLKNVNSLYNHICAGVLQNGKFTQKYADYNTSKQYQIIRANADALNLKCPSYFELVRMAQRHTGQQSFSTVFMEYNGYNGVNVSGIDFYDNTTHGSVIYDLSKVNTDMQEVRPKALWGYGQNSYDGTVVYDYFDDISMQALDGNLMSDNVKKLPSLPLAQAMRVLKNYTKSGNVLDTFQFKYIGDDLTRRYLTMMYKHNPTDSWNNPLCDEFLDRRYAEVIVNMGLYFWANYTSKKGSMLLEMLDAFSFMMDWNLSAEEEYNKKKQFLETVMKYLQRDLTPFEKEYIQEDYYAAD